VPAPATAERSWFVVARWQEYAGEGRANLLRVVALVAFYGVQLVNHLMLEEPSKAAQAFQRQTTLVIAGWSLLAVAVLICLQRGFLPAALKYVSTAADVALLTLLAKAGQGANGPLIEAYFLILALAALRFSVGLIWFATLASMAGYLGLVGAADPKWFDEEHITPAINQLVMLTSLALTGVVLGQVVRRVRALAEEFAARSQAKGGVS
jgi:hypothetical protein